MADIVNLGLRIQQCRMKKKLTQEELAEIVGTTQGYLSRIENGKEVPSRDLVIKICAALDVTTDYIFYGDSGCDNPRVDAFISWIRRQKRETQDQLLDIIELVKVAFDKDEQGE